VLLLLPIIGNPLQARYHGPYIIEKPISNLNYMLKSYFDKDNVSSHFVNIVNSVPFENIDCKIQIEDKIL